MRLHLPKLLACLSVAIAALAATPNAYPASANELTDFHRSVLQQAESGHVVAQFVMGNMYYTGKGAPKDYTQAYYWYNLAAASGQKDATQNRAVIEKKMTPAQIAKAQAMSAEFVAVKASRGTPYVAPYVAP